MRRWKPAATKVVLYEMGPQYNNCPAECQSVTGVAAKSTDSISPQRHPTDLIINATTGYAARQIPDPGAGLSVRHQTE